MPPDLALLSTLNGSNYPGLELIFMVPKVVMPLGFDCNCSQNDNAEPSVEQLDQDLTYLSHYLTHCILVGSSSTIIYCMSLFVILGVSGIFCNSYTMICLPV